MGLRETQEKVLNASMLCPSLLCQPHPSTAVRIRQKREDYKPLATCFSLFIHL